MDSRNSRRKFLEQLFTASVVAVAAPTVLLGKLTPRITSRNNGLSGVYTISLQKFTALQTVGGSLRFTVPTVPTRRVIVTQVATSAFTAVSDICTHDGTIINTYDKVNKWFLCPQHFSKFDSSGAVLVGPAALPLKSYPATYDGVDTVTVDFGNIAAVFQEDALAVSLTVTGGDSNMAVAAFTLDKPAHVLLSVFSADGTNVLSLVNEDCEAGTHRISHNTSSLPNGMYFYRIQTSSGFMKTCKFVLAR